MRSLNIYLDLKLDNGKVVSIANGQTEWQSHPVPYYDIDIEKNTVTTKIVFIILLIHNIVERFKIKKIKIN